MSTGTQIEVVMPQMGVSVSEGTITKWLKQPGEPIARDEPLLEISTDKVDTEVPSPAKACWPRSWFRKVRPSTSAPCGRIGAGRQRGGHAAPEPRLLPLPPAAPAAAAGAACSRRRGRRRGPATAARACRRAGTAAAAPAAPVPPPLRRRRRPATDGRSSLPSSRASPPSTASIPTAVPGTGTGGRVDEEGHPGLHRVGRPGTCPASSRRSLPGARRGAARTADHRACTAHCPSLHPIPEPAPVPRPPTKRRSRSRSPSRSRRPSRRRRDHRRRPSRRPQPESRRPARRSSR